MFLFTYHRQMTVYFLPKHTINDDGYSKVYSNCINMLLKTSKFKYRTWGRNLIFPLYFKRLCYNKKRLAFTMHTGLCPTYLNALDFFKTIIFKIFEYVHPWRSCTQLVFQWSMCWRYQECKPICTPEGTSPLELDIGHYHVLHLRDDARVALCGA